MFRILFGVKQQDERQFERIAINVPECPECNRGPLFPIAASMSDSALKVAAHRTFVDALRCLNETIASRAHLATSKKHSKKKSPLFVRERALKLFKHFRRVSSCSRDYSYRNRDLSDVPLA